MVDINLNKSNGSCWSNVNVALEDDYIPCGNAASGNSYACCHYGDNCLSSNACYHDKYGITYLAGCTDQDFSGPACQNKGPFFNQSWVGLTRCDPDKNTWAGCPETDDGIVGDDPPTSNCKCMEDTVLFEDMPMLENIASLPQRLGGSISWFPGHKPTKTSSTRTTTSTSTQTTHTSMTDSQTSTESDTGSSADDLTDSSPPTSPAIATSTAPATAHATGLNAGAKAGIAVGSVFGALLVAFLVFILARKRRAAKGNPSVQPFLPTTESQPIQPEPPAPTFSALSGFKAELPAEGPPSGNSWAPSSIPNSPSPLQSPSQSPPLSSTPVQYQPYRPGVYANSRHSDVSQLSSQTQSYPESVTSASTPRIPEDPRRGYRRSGQPDTIHELQG